MTSAGTIRRQVKLVSVKPQPHDQSGSISLFDSWLELKIM